MIKERTAAVANVAAAFLPAEQSIEVAAAQSASCIATMIEERAKANLPLDTGAEALQLVADATLALLQARAKMHAAHALLREVPGRIGLRTLDYGDSGCPPNTPFTTAELRSVA